MLKPLYNIRENELKKLFNIAWVEQLETCICLKWPTEYTLEDDGMTQELGQI